MSSKRRFALIEWSFEMIPRPVHGASKRTLSNVPGNIAGIFLPSRQITAVLVIPNLYKLNCKALRRSFLRSLAKTQPVFFII